MSKLWKIPRSPSVDEQMQKYTQTHTTKYHSAIKKNKSCLHKNEVGFRVNLGVVDYFHYSHVIYYFYLKQYKKQLYMYNYDIY